MKMKYTPRKELHQQRDEYHTPSRYPTPRKQNTPSNSFHQQQIEDLQKKVDLILLHNEQLLTENTVLKRQIEDLKCDSLRLHSIVSKQSRLKDSHQIHSEYESQIIELEIENNQIKTQLFHLTSQAQNLQLKLSRTQTSLIQREEQLKQFINTNQQLSHSNQTLQNQLIKLIAQEQTFKQEISSLKHVIINKDAKEIQLKAKIKEDASKISSQKQLLQMQMEKLIQQNKQLQKAEKYKQQLQQLKNKYKAKQNEMIQEHQNQIKQLQKHKQLLMERLQEQYQEDLNKIKQQNMEKNVKLKIELEQEYNKQLQKKQQNNIDKIQQERDKAQKYIKLIQNGHQMNEREADYQLIEQIKMLKQTLCSKQNMMGELLRWSDLKGDNYYEEVKALQTKMEHMVQVHLAEIELLKVELGQTQALAVREVAQVYNNKIQILSAQVIDLRKEKGELRSIYQQEVRDKLAQRKYFELESSKLKNMIRKLKIQLQGLSDEYRLNIDGIRDNNNTFSMSILKNSMQEKEKANFFQEQNRKLREMYARNQKQMNNVKTTASQKIKTVEQKSNYYKQLLEDERNDLKIKSEQLQKQLQNKEQLLREGYMKDRQYLLNQIDELKLTKNKLQQEIFQLKQKFYTNEAAIKQQYYNVDLLNKKLQQKQIIVEQLKMELQMAGNIQIDKKQSDGEWKVYYERTIDQQKQQIKLLQENIQTKNNQLQQITVRSKSMEKELLKTVKLLKNREEIDRRVLLLGTDQNLIKNLAQLFNN